MLFKALVNFNTYGLRSHINHGILVFPKYDIRTLLFLVREKNTDYYERMVTLWTQKLDLNGVKGLQ